MLDRLRAFPDKKGSGERDQIDTRVQLVAGVRIELTTLGNETSREPFPYPQCLRCCPDTSTDQKWTEPKTDPCCLADNADILTAMRPEHNYSSNQQHERNHIRQKIEDNG